MTEQAGVYYNGNSLGFLKIRREAVESSISLAQQMVIKLEKELLELDAVISQKEREYAKSVPAP